MDSCAPGRTCTTRPDSSPRPGAAAADREALRFSERGHWGWRAGVDEKNPFHTPFAGRKDKLGALPRGPEPREPERRSDAPKGPARAVVRLERKGRRGKDRRGVEQLARRAARV